MHFKIDVPIGLPYFVENFTKVATSTKLNYPHTYLIYSVKVRGRKQTFSEHFEVAFF